MTLSTHSLLRKSRSSRLVVSPTSPSTTLLEPRLLSTWKPFSRSSSSSLSISVSGAFCFITIIIRIPPLCLQAMLLYCVMASTQKKRSLDQTLRPITAYHHPSPLTKKDRLSWACPRFLSCLSGRGDPLMRIRVRQIAAAIIIADGKVIRICSSHGVRDLSHGGSSFRSKLYQV